jgi:mannose-6-phosphate isomerase-like protein (cupin superfamily)
MAKHTSRRSFLRTAPIAAAAGLSLTQTLRATAETATEQAPAAVPYAFFSSKQLDGDAKALQAKPGNNNLIDQKPGLPCAIVMTAESHKSATEFEWHEGRDHIVQVIDGMTLYEVGGTPKNGRNTKPGEWLAPASEGSKSIMMMKGDTLIIPRGTPHKRSTEDSVTFLLISPYGEMKA